MSKTKQLWWDRQEERWAEIEAAAHSRAIQHCLEGKEGFKYQLDDESVEWADEHWEEFVTAEELTEMEGR